ncbi:MAG: glycoside hydrolase family 3 C-terminal domain-containing protein, partial [Trebonia sp.]
MKPVSGASRRHLRTIAILAVVVLALPLAVLAAPANAGGARAALTAASSATCPWLNQSLSIAKRVQLLMAQMTLADKINMVTGAGTSEPYVFYIAAIPSLCVPAIGEEDGPVGVGDGLTGVTQMPSAVSLAASFDTPLAYQYGQVVGSEERAKGAMVDLGPTVNIDRDPRWGRSFEAYTEDPYLNSALAVADVDGVQSQDEMAQIKHLAVYNQETNRNTPADNAIVSTRALQEIYLPAFYAGTTEAHASSVMCAYSTINSQAACQNQYLMQTTLDQDWGYPGFVTSDYGATHSTVQSADAGMDQEMPSAQFYGPALESAVQDGQVPIATLNDMVSRILTEMFKFNEFNNPPTGTTSATVTTAAHQAVSTSVAEQGTVLLKNSGATLPLSASGAGAVAVIGPAASAAPTDTGGGSAYVTSTFNVTPLQGIQAAAGSGTTVQYVQGLPTDTSLSPIPSTDLTPAYAATGYGASYTGTLTAPETGTYVLAFKNPGSYTATNLYLDGKEILANPGTPPVSTYSVSVDLTAGQAYTLSLSGGGPSASLSWATPSGLAPGIAQAVAAAKSAATAVVVVSDDTESEAADRVGLSLPSAQNELIAAVAAANPHTVVIVDAGAPVAMPWLSQVSSVLDAWYPGESNGTALASVLFGQTNPSGHLPVTFPTSLSQVPASTPSQFPGTGGEVQYSEGIDVGYRYYDANNETPLFPFGYGLSYTTFGYSHLSVTPQQVMNGTSNPGTPACGCNGQSGNQVTVSATVTNTGRVTGSDVAQLYLDDPAASGEPPRQLKGFQKVTLKPGQSTTVHFTLSGQDLSYWDDTANGWVLPDGRFGVDVGDSSALANLPLRGSFTVDRTLGARYATVSTPATVTPGTPARVTATLVNDGDYAMPQARFTLKAPAGWTVRNPAPVTIAPGQTVTEHFTVTAPASAPAGTDTLQVAVRSTAGNSDDRSVTTEASATGTVAYSSLTAAYNNTGISDNANVAAGNYDGVGDSYSAQALAAGTPTALTPGKQVT